MTVMDALAEPRAVLFAVSVAVPKAWPVIWFPLAVATAGLLLVQVTVFGAPWGVVVTITWPGVVDVTTKLDGVISMPVTDTDGTTLMLQFAENLPSMVLTETVEVPYARGVMVLV